MKPARSEPQSQCSELLDRDQSEFVDNNLAVFVESSPDHTYISLKKGSKNSNFKCSALNFYKLTSVWIVCM